MDILFLTLLGLVSVIADLAGNILTCLLDTDVLSVAVGSSTAVVILLAVTGYSEISEGALANIKKWHGGIEDQFSCIDNLIKVIEQDPTGQRPMQFMELLDNYKQLDELIKKCKTPAASAADRTIRNSLLKSTVGLCLLQIKGWAYGEFSAGNISADEVHLMGFLLPGEHGGRHSRTEATDTLAEVKAKVINEDFIHVVIDQSSDENAGPVLHGWPSGVKQGLIVIIAVDGKTEVLRQLTTHLHNDIEMPKGSHGKQFIIKAAFLKHIDDEPRFGNELVFSMPITTQDLLSTLDNQHHKDDEARIEEIEKHRLEIERLQEELKKKKDE